MDNKQLGRNIASLRGDTKQGEIAQKMQQRGHNWVQRTVSMVETGDRTLKLFEAVDLAAVLGVTLDEMTTAPVAIELQSEIRSNIQYLISKWEAANEALKTLVRAREEYGYQIPTPKELDLELVPDSLKRDFVVNFNNLTEWEAVRTGLWVLGDKDNNEILEALEKDAKARAKKVRWEDLRERVLSDDLFVVIEDV